MLHKMREMNLTGQNFIGFERSANGSQLFTATNPSTLETLPVGFSEATQEEVDKAIEKAELAFVTYRKKSGEERARFLEAIAEEVLALGDPLIERCMAETALPEARLIGERGRTVNQLKLFAEVLREGSWVGARIDTAIPDRQPIPKPDIRQIQVPLGPVGIFGASNFPLAFSVAGGDTVSALAAGCSIVVKAHPLHPGTSELVGQAIISAAQKTGMPAGVFSLLQGQSNEVGMAIVRHPLITAVGFTGSFGGGKALFDAANQRPTPIPVFAEMGSSNPVFVLPGALKERKEKIVQGLVGSLNLGVGQFCTNPGLLIINSQAETSGFIQEMSELVSQTPSGTMLSSGIKTNYSRGTERLNKHSGVVFSASGSAGSDGNRVESKIFKTKGSELISNPDLAEEVFGPSMLCAVSSDKDEMLKIAHSLQGHLTATIHGTDEDLADYAELISILERKVGRIIFNGYPTGVEVCHSMVHGGPYPATTAPQSTSVGTAAIQRFARPVCYQDFPVKMLPDELKDGNPLGIWRMYNGEMGKI